jgi:acetyl-CoA acyltransferase
MSGAYLVASVRSPIAKAHRGELRDQRPDDFAAQVIKGALAKVPNLDPAVINDIILGCAFPEGEQGFNAPRNIGQLIGLPNTVGGMVINRFCSSGLQSIALAASLIENDSTNFEAVIAGGMESMTRIPPGGATFFPNPSLLTANEEIYWGMGLTAEEVAKEFAITRDEQDQFAFESHQKASAYLAAKLYLDEVIPISVNRTVFEKGKAISKENIFSVDEGPRKDTSLEALAKLKPVFKAQGGSVTAGNSSQVSDGAAASIIVSEKILRQFNLIPMARLASFAISGNRPGIMGVAPIDAIPMALAKAGITLDQVGWIELNEAFASQSVAIKKALGLNPAILNPYGGAISWGHPLGATGARQTATGLHGAIRTGARYFIVAMCIGGGMGAAAVFENLMPAPIAELG